MKRLNEFIFEKLDNKEQLSLQPKTRAELDKLLKVLIEERGFDADLNDIDVSNITDMSELFGTGKRYLVKFNGDISKWDVSNVTNMSWMFNNCKFTGENGDISNWDVSKVKDMTGMFFCSLYNNGLSNWKIDSLTSMDRMFFGCAFTGENGDISNWDVSNITNMKNMFCQSKYNGDLSKWDVSKVKDMSSMFSGSKFTGQNGDISNWDVSNVENMGAMFSDNKKYNGDISKWKVSKVKNMSFMFQNSKFKGNIDNWDVSNVEDMTNIFNRSSLENNPPKWYLGDKLSKETKEKLQNIPASDKAKLIELNSKLTKNKGGALSSDEMSLLKKYYKEDKNLSVKYPCNRKGSDVKYGSFFVDPINMKWRGKTFDEFYGGGIVD